MVEDGAAYCVYCQKGEDLAKLTDSNGDSGKWIVGKTYYCVERTIAGGWDLDDPTHIFENRGDATQCRDRLEAASEPVESSQ